MEKENLKINENIKKDLVKKIKQNVNSGKNKWKTWESLIVSNKKHENFLNKFLLIKTQNKSESISLLAIKYSEENKVELLIKFKKHKNFFYIKKIEKELIEKFLDNKIFPELIFKINRRLKKLGILI